MLRKIKTETTKIRKNVFSNKLLKVTLLRKRFSNFISSMNHFWPTHVI